MAKVVVTEQGPTSVRERGVRVCVCVCDTVLKERRRGYVREQEV